MRKLFFSIFFAALCQNMAIFACNNTPASPEKDSTELRKLLTSPSPVNTGSENGITPQHVTTEQFATPCAPHQPDDGITAPPSTPTSPTSANKIYCGHLRSSPPQHTLTPPSSFAPICAMISTAEQKQKYPKD